MKLKYHLSQEDIADAIKQYLNDYRSDDIRYRELKIEFNIEVGVKSKTIDAIVTVGEK